MKETLLIILWICSVRTEDGNSFNNLTTSKVIDVRKHPDNLTNEYTVTNNVDLISYITIPYNASGTNQNEMKISMVKSEGTVENKTPVEPNLDEQYIKNEENKRCCLVIYPPKCGPTNCTVTRRKECSAICTQDVVILDSRYFRKLNDTEFILPTNLTTDDDFEDHITIDKLAPLEHNQTVYRTSYPAFPHMPFPPPPGFPPNIYSPPPFKFPGNCNNTWLTSNFTFPTPYWPPPPPPNFPWTPPSWPNTNFTFSPPPPLPPLYPPPFPWQPFPSNNTWGRNGRIWQNRIDKSLNETFMPFPVWNNTNFNSSRNISRFPFPPTFVPPQWGFPPAFVPPHWGYPPVQFRPIFNTNGTLAHFPIFPNYSGNFPQQNLSSEANKMSNPGNGTIIDYFGPAPPLPVYDYPA